MRREISAGCVIHRREQSIEVALIRPRDRDVWTLPKGLLDPGESPEVAAEREAREETGLFGRLGPKIDTVKYIYSAKWENPPGQVFKIVTYYLLEWSGGDTSQHDREVERVEWFPIDEAIKLAGFSSDKAILKKARTLLT
jgi:8-oxo-dGTP pyrophosphatase MutT (NUDIX family)